MLIKDERIRRFETHLPVLEKMLMDRILSKSEVKAFEQTLEPHQKAILSDGSSVLDRAVIEHNVLAASKIYNSVSFEELSRLLSIDITQTERISLKMIKENRLKGSVDQVSGFISFSDGDSVLLELDSRIRDFCLQVDDVIANIGKQFPDQVTAII